jgi:hypothetical protein
LGSFGVVTTATSSSTPIKLTRSRKAGDLQRFMFTRVPQQKAEFEKLGIPFYDPKRLANWRATHQPIWDPKQLDNFHLGE